MNSIIDNQREILLSIQGTNIWSGQQPQQYNSQAIAWGGLSHELFSAGQRYQWVPWAYLVGLFVPIPFWVAHRFWPKLRFDYFYTPIIAYVQHDSDLPRVLKMLQVLHWVALRRNQLVNPLLFCGCLPFPVVATYTLSPLVRAV